MPGRSFCCSTDRYKGLATVEGAGDTPLPSDRLFPPTQERALNALGCEHDSLCRSVHSSGHEPRAAAYPRIKGGNMYAVRELLSLDQRPEKTQQVRLPAAGDEDPAAQVRLAARIEETVAAGGMVKAYLDNGRMLGLCLVRNDGWNQGHSHLMVTELLATGSPDDQALIRIRLLSALLGDLHGSSCTVTAELGADNRSGAAAFEAAGFRRVDSLKSHPGQGMQLEEWEPVLKPLGCTLGRSTGGNLFYRYERTKVLNP